MTPPLNHFDLETRVNPRIRICCSRFYLNPWLVPTTAGIHSPWRSVAFRERCY